MMIVVMMVMMVHIHSIGIRIIHFIVIHPGHDASTRKIAVKHRSVQRAVLLRLHVKTPLVAHDPTVMSESRLAVLVGAIAVHAVREGDLLQVRT